MGIPQRFITVENRSNVCSARMVAASRCRLGCVHAIAAQDRCSFRRAYCDNCPAKARALASSNRGAGRSALAPKRRTSHYGSGHDHRPRRAQSSNRQRPRPDANRSFADIRAAARAFHAGLPRSRSAGPRVRLCIRCWIEDPYNRSLAPLASLAPDVQQAILAGRQPEGMGLPELITAGIPLCWNAQRRMFSIDGIGT